MIELNADYPPRRWVDSHEFLESLSDADRAEGQRLGELIDTEDDEDNGGFR